MANFHLDPQTLAVKACSGRCPLYPARAHYKSNAEAVEARIFLETFERTCSTLPRLFFDVAHSALTDKDYLQATLATPFGELAHFTVEEQGDLVVGSMLLAGQEHILSQSTKLATPESLQEVAREALTVAHRLHRVDLWPSLEIVQLYEEFQKDSLPSAVSASTVQLEENFSSQYPQLYRGETLRGTDVTVKVAYGYAVAEAILDGSSTVIHEGNLRHQIFTEEQERNAFMAKSFGTLLAMGEL